MIPSAQLILGWASLCRQRAQRCRRCLIHGQGIESALGMRESKKFIPKGIFRQMGNTIYVEDVVVTTPRICIWLNASLALEEGLIGDRYPKRHGPSCMRSSPSASLTSSPKQTGAVRAGSEHARPAGGSSLISSKAWPMARSAGAWQLCMDGELDTHCDSEVCTAPCLFNLDVH